MRAGSIQCPAKINTFLSVGPPDSTGYHPLRTVFQAVSVFDRLFIEPAERDHVDCLGMELPATNTLTRSLAFVRELVPVPPLAIKLIKGIPAESGMGGGSSDAAGLLRLLAKLVPGGLPEYFCREVAAAVGSDAPFFLVGGRTVGEGYGEKLTPLPDLPRRELVVVKPKEGRATAQAYAELDAQPREWLELDPDAFYNDFERVAGCASHEATERLLAHGATAAQLTGSGSAVFGVFADAATADAAAQGLRAEGVGAVYRCHTLTREESLWTS